MSSSPLQDESESKTSLIHEACFALPVARQQPPSPEDELSPSHGALQLMTACSQLLIEAEDEKKLLQQVCQMALDFGGYRLAWVGFAHEDDRKTVQPQAWAGRDLGYLSAVEIRWCEDCEAGRGPAGCVIRSGMTYLCSDIRLAPEFAPWRETAEGCGYRGVLCLPLKDRDRTFGVLCLHSGEVFHPSPWEIKLLEGLAQNLAFGIGTLRLRRERQQLETAVLQVAAGLNATTGAGFFEDLSRHLAEALGASFAGVAQLVPGSTGGARTVGATLRGGPLPATEYRVGDTPCQILLDQPEGVVEARLLEAYPKAQLARQCQADAYVGHRLTNSQGRVLGFLFALFPHRLEHSHVVSSTMKIFAARAAAELERREVEERLQEQAALLDAAHEAIYVKDLNHRIVYWNRGAERLYGYSASRALGSFSNELFKANPARYREAFEFLMQHGEWQGELEKFAQDGNARTLEVSWTLVRDAQGRPTSVLAINFDVTEKKKLESQLLRAQRMESIGTMAGGIAHDLNNVLAPIVMACDIVKEMIVEPEGLKLLEAMKKSARRGADLVRQLLTFARGVQGQRVLVDVSTLLNDLFLLMRETFPKSIRLDFQGPGECSPVRGDPTQLHQVFLNLCVNARDALPRGGHLTLTWGEVWMSTTHPDLPLDGRPGNYLRVAIQDDGEGIPASLQEKIFEPFFTTKELGQGTGLGLSTSLAIVKNHGGFILLQSQADTGTQFQVFLPVVPKESQLPTQAPPTVSVPPGRGEVVLVVDDETAIRSVLTRILERSGYRPLQACNGREALDLYQQHRAEVACVVTDMAMPGMDGPQLIQQLKALSPHLPVVGASGLATGEVMSAVSAAGVEYFLPKPYTAELVVKTVAQALGRLPNQPGQTQV